MKPPSKPLLGLVTNAIASGPGPRSRLRARRWGLDALAGKAPPLELYYEAGDPHSHLCAQLLPALRRRLKTRLVVRVVGAPPPVLYPEADKQRHFAVQDAVRIAPAWGLEFPAAARLPSAAARAAAAAELVAAEADLDVFIEREAQLAPPLWTGGSAPSGAPSADAAQRLGDNNARRERLGHYLPGMWQFGGEWFWGVDRLNHLERRLRRRGLLEGDAPVVDFDAAKARLPPLEAGAALEFFYSFRSPYSALAAQQMTELQPRLGVPLTIRPVLPMVMRGLKVPPAKRLYIVRDVYREAQLLGIPFGRMADPVGAGAERCLAVFPLAEQAGRGLAFIAAASRAIWSEAVDVATDRGLRYVCGQAGVDWGAAAAVLAGAPALDYAEENRRAMFSAGFWGVPDFRIGDFGTWGRDRLWMVEEVMRRAGKFGSASAGGKPRPA